jgi:NlpC/P60 family putative phage cell wall peptidase
MSGAPDHGEDTAFADRVVAEARSWIGTPYFHGASLKGVGCDCLGLVRGVWRAVLGPEPEQAGPYSPDWAEAGGEERLLAAARRHMLETDLADVRPGDVLLFRWRDGVPAKHLGIATGEGRMVHAHDGAEVTEVSTSVWRRRLAYAFRLPPASHGSPASRPPQPGEPA